MTTTLHGATPDTAAAHTRAHATRRAEPLPDRELVAIHERDANAGEYACQAETDRHTLLGEIARMRELTAEAARMRDLAVEAIHLRGILADAIPNRDALVRVMELDDDKRDRLIRTLEVWIDTGDTTAAAQRLYCHRNTVANRLHELERLTGLRLQSGPPRDVVAAALLLRIHQRATGEGDRR